MTNRKCWCNGYWNYEYHETYNTGIKSPCRICYGTGVEPLKLALPVKEVCKCNCHTSGFPYKKDLHYDGISRSDKLCRCFDLLKNGDEVIICPKCQDVFDIRYDECICGYTGTDFVIFKVTKREIKSLLEIDIDDISETSDNVALFEFKRFMKEQYNTNPDDKLAILELNKNDKK